MDRLNLGQGRPRSRTTQIDGPSLAGGAPVWESSGRTTIQINRDKDVPFAGWRPRSPATSHQGGYHGYCSKK